MKVRDRIDVILDLMMGALYADDVYSQNEDKALRSWIAKLLLVTPQTLPAEVDARIRGFDPKTFDLALAARDFLTDPPMKKRRLLELVGNLVEVDGTDIREDDYMRALAMALEMQPEEYQDLVLDYSIEELRKSFEMVRISEIEANRGTIGVGD